MIKIFIKRIIGEYTVARIKRIKHKLVSQKKNIETNCPYQVLSNDYHTTCGYYDHDPIQSGRILIVATDKQLKSVNNLCIDLETKKILVSIQSALANWQQANRLQWLGMNRFIFNDFVQGSFVSKEYKEGNLISHPFPIYDANENIGISIDFLRTGYLRAGYGYTNLSFPEIEGNDIAIRVFRLEDNVILNQICYSDILSHIEDNVNLRNCYINHVSIAPDGRKFLFFFIEKRASYHMCYLFVFEDGKLKIIENELSASHYTWKNNNQIVTTSYDKQRKCGYYLYDLNKHTRDRLMGDILTDDGHPTFITEEIFVTDTYPDKAGFQKVKLVNLSINEVETVISIYSTAKHMGEMRCDLHPRYDADTKKIVFDADVDGHRRVYIINLEEQKWLSKIGKEN